MNLQQAILVSTTILITGQIVNASDMANNDHYMQKSGEFVDNIFDYAVAQYSAPEGIKLVNQKVDHPVFGEMYVISHKDDIDYYNSRITEDTAEALVDDILKYVVEIASKEIQQDELQDVLLKMASTKVGMNTLKVIVAKYIKVYNKHKCDIERFLNAEERISEIDAEITKQGMLYEEISKKYNRIVGRLNSNCVQFKPYSFETDLSDLSESKANKIVAQFETYHKYHMELQTINEKLKNKIESEEQGQLFNKKEQILEKIMTSDDYIRAIYKDFQRILEDEFGVDVVHDIYKYLYLKSENSKYKELIQWASESQQNYKAIEERFKNLFNSKKGLAEISQYAEDAFDIIGDIDEHTYYRLEDYEKEYFRAKLKRFNVQSKVIEESINALEKEKQNLREFKKLNITYEPGKNAYSYEYNTKKHEITLGKSPNHMFYQISSDGQIVSERAGNDQFVGMLFDDRKDGTQLKGIQHEMIHFKDNITGNYLIVENKEIDEIGILDKMKDEFKTNIGTMGNITNEQIMEILDRIYDNTREMMCMYGVLHHKGTFYFDPLNEALATAEKDVYYTKDKNSDIKTVRLGHKVSLAYSSDSYKEIDQATKLYSWYFNPELRKLADL